MKVASCGKCRYAVEGLTAMTCPECGSDLRVVGILTPGGRNRIGPVIWIALWTLALPVPALIITALTSESLPSIYLNQRSITLHTTSPGYVAAEIDIWGQGMRSPNTYEWAVVNLEKSIGGTIRINLLTNAYRSETSDGVEDGDHIDTIKLKSWMASATGLPESEFDDDAVELLANIKSAVSRQGVSSSGAFDNVSTRTFQRVQKPAWYGYAAIVFWIAVWIGGMVLIVKRSRQKKAAQSNCRIVSLNSL